MVWNRLFDEEATFVLIIVVVADTPLVELVNTLADEVRVLLFTALKLVVDATPFTLEVRVTPLVVVDTVSPLDEMIEEVADTPFTLTVRVLPDTEAVNELMILVIAEEIPFTIV